MVHTCYYIMLHPYVELVQGEDLGNLTWYAQSEAERKENKKKLPPLLKPEYIGWSLVGAE